VAHSAPVSNLVLTCSDENAIGQPQNACDGIWVYERPTNPRIVSSGSSYVWRRFSDLIGSDTVLVCTLPVEPGQYSSCRDGSGARRMALVRKDTLISGPMAQSAAANVWVATSRRITLVSPKGDRLLTTVPPTGTTFRISATDADSSDGGFWFVDPANRNLVKVGPSGVPVRTIGPLQSPSTLEVDARDGSVWTTVFTPAGTRDLVKFSAFGEELVRIAFANFISDLAVDEVSGVLWVANTVQLAADKAHVVRLEGSDEELNGYDVSAPSGPRHVRIEVDFPRSLSVDPRTGNVWVADDGGDVFLKLAPTGEVLGRGVPSFGFDQILVRADAITGGAWGMVGNGDAGALQFSESGQQRSAIQLFRSVGDYSTIRSALLPSTIALDPYERLLWIGTRDIENFNLNGGSLLLMNYEGERLLRLRESEEVDDIVIQTVRAPIVIGPRQFNPKDEKLARVAVLTQGEFDALQVDPLSGRLGPARAVARHQEVRDVDKDGDADLLLYFKLPQTGIRCEDQGAELTARTHLGVAVLSWVALPLEHCPGRRHAPNRVH
jgi:hypothetical protein